MINADYNEFIKRLSLFVQKNKSLITITLSNIFTMRLIGNKTHGDLAEIAISEFINQYMDGYKSTHVGKHLYRAKSKEEDIKITNLVNQREFSVSLKAYGEGPLQLSTDKDFEMYPLLESYLQGNKKIIDDKKILSEIFSSKAFSHFREINILPLIYNENENKKENKNKCNILFFDVNKVIANTAYIKKVTTRKNGKERIHHPYVFYDKDENYICEVRPKGKDGNALQRGLWTHTKKAAPYFDSVTGGWIDYSNNKLLVNLFSYSLVASEMGHEEAIKLVQKDIERLKTYKA